MKFKQERPFAIPEAAEKKLFDPPRKDKHWGRRKLARER
jgi:hypothetical protein